MICLGVLNKTNISLRNEKNRAIFQLQAGICSGIRHFLDNHEFTEIHTPKLGASGAEGGATRVTPIQPYNFLKERKRY